MSEKKILIVDNDRLTRNSLQELLSRNGFLSEVVSCFDDTIKELGKNSYKIVIIDINLPDQDTFKLLKIINKQYPFIKIIITSEFASVSKAVEAIKEGAFDFITKPINEESMLHSIDKAFQNIELLNDDNKNSKENTYSGLYNIMGCDRKMMDIFDIIESVAPTKATVLITGSSGTGKSMVARAIHQMSDRADNPFVEVSCGSLPETLLESELFGHIKGAFTGAIADKEGKFLAADGGTLFLDEINSASPSMQVKLLRVLQHKMFEPVGSNKTHEVNVRILLATNKNLTRLIDKGIFREDLYYRINVINIDLPDLNQRNNDIIMLAEHFLKKLSKYHDKSFSGFSTDTIDALVNYHWPGNVRELENAIERAVVLGKQNTITIQDLPGNISESAAESISGKDSHQSLKKALEIPEKQIIVNTLKQCNWNRNKTAEILEINRTTLYKKMKYYDLYAG